MDTHNGVVGLWWAADYPNEKRAGVLNRSGAHPILELVGSFSEALLQTLQDPAYRPAIHGLSDGRAYTLLDSQSLMDIYKALEVANGNIPTGPGHLRHRWVCDEWVAGAHVRMSDTYKEYHAEIGNTNFLWLGKGGGPSPINSESMRLYADGDLEVTLDLRLAERRHRADSLVDANVRPSLQCRSRTGKTLSEYDSVVYSLINFVSVLTKQPSWLVSAQAKKEGDGVVVVSPGESAAHLEEPQMVEPLVSLHHPAFPILASAWIANWPDIGRASSLVAPPPGLSHYPTVEAAMAVAGLETVLELKSNARVSQHERTVRNNEYNELKRILGPVLKENRYTAAQRNRIYHALKLGVGAPLEHRLSAFVSELGSEVNQSLFRWGGGVKEWAATSSELRNVLLHGLRRNAWMHKDQALALAIRDVCHRLIVLGLLDHYGGNKVDLREVAALQRAAFSEGYNWRNSYERLQSHSPDGV